MPAFDVEALRRRFPALAIEQDGRPVALFDGPGGTQVPDTVIEAVARYYRESNANSGGSFLTSERSDAISAEAHEAAADMIGAGDAHEITFGPNMTTLTFHLSRSIAAALEPGDEIVLTGLDHHANVDPWLGIARDRGLGVRTWEPRLDDCTLRLEDLEPLLGPRTRLVCVGWASNAVGTINPVAEIIEAAHAVGALTLLDGAQAIVHGRVDVQALDVDFYVFSGHKLYGPTGIGVLYGKAERLAALPPYQGGGEMIGEVSLEKITYADPPHRFEAGTPAIVEAVGLSAVIEWLNTLDREAIAAHEHRLLKRVTDGLAGANWLKPIGTAPGKGAIFSFTVENAHAHDVAQILDRYGIAVRAGTHCAEPLMRRFGVTSSVRASFALYNTVEEADAFVESLNKAQSFFS